MERNKVQIKEKQIALLNSQRETIRAVKGMWNCIFKERESK